MNYVKTFMLLAALTALFVGVGYMVGGYAGMAIALGLAIAMNAFAYWNADRLVLSQFGAQEVDASHPNPVVQTYVQDTLAMAREAGMPAPKIYLIDSAQPNAFATGRDPQHAAVAATVGILRLLDRSELRGVMAHELAHVKNRDTLIMTVTATIAGAISVLANVAMFFGPRDSEGRQNPLLGIVIMIVAPLAAAIVQMAISRSREYDADRMGAGIAQDPRALARALEKIELYARGERNIQAENNPALAHLFIINPLHGEGADNLFSTHPATRNRIAKLYEIAGASPDREPPRGPIRMTPGAPGSTSGPWGERARGDRQAGPWG